MSAEAGRVYGGRTPQERLDGRREQLLEAALEVFAARGWNAATVLQVCRSARLSQRSFYEHFADREAVFLAVLDRVAADVEQVVRAAATAPGRTPEQRVTGVLEALAAAFTADPRTVRVALVESFATPALRAARARLAATFTALAAELMASLRPRTSPADRRALELSAAVLTGGVVEALVAAASGEPLADPDELVAHLTRLFVAAATLDP